MRGVANKMKKGGSIVMFASMYGLVSPKMEMYPKILILIPLNMVLEKLV